MRFELIEQYNASTVEYEYLVKIRDHGQTTTIKLPFDYFRDIEQVFQEFIEGYTSKPQILKTVVIGDE